LALAKGCDHLFIEATFLEKDRRLAEQKKHLTAKQAGTVAAAAGAGRFTIFHFSPRYTGNEEALEKEAMDAFTFPPGTPGA
jgi:ribonuclease Z